MCYFVVSERLKHASVVNVAKKLSQLTLKPQDGQSQELARYLPERRRKRKPRYARTPRGMMFPLERSIHNRPDYVKDRSIFGDWEGDLMIFRREHGKANVASLVERKTRFAVIVPEQ